jgi:arginase family enzyme
MYVIGVPYHLDEALPELGLPLRADETVRVPPPDGGVWDSMAAVFGVVSRAVSRAVSARQVPVVVSGDCSTALGTVAGLQQAGLDPPEVTYLDQSRIQRGEVDRLSARLLPSGPLYVHLDLDVVDPAEVGGLRFPAPGGPSLAQVTAALRMLAGTGRVVAAGVACTWRPEPGAGARSPDLLTSALRYLAK